jgi:serine protease Do
MLACIALSTLCAGAALSVPPAIAQTLETPNQEGAIPDLAEQATESVVRVTATRSAAGSSHLDQVPNDDFLNEFFRRFGEEDGPVPDLPFAPPEPGTGPAQASGSGFIIDPEGLIVTADALVADADRVDVTLPDGSSQRAEVVGHDGQTGIALLRIETDQQLPALSWGSSDDLRLGEGLLAVGSAEGLGTVLSTGVLAARSTDGQRLLIDDQPASVFVGAPVLDEAGRVVAVRTGAQDTAQTGATAALAAEAAREIAEELATSGTVARGYLGVQVQPVTADIAEALGLERPEGAMVAEVQPDTPAAEADLRSGDVILALDGEAVSGPEALSSLVASREPGDSVQLEVWRSEEALDLTVTLAARLGSEAPDASDVLAEGVAVPELGVTLHPITPDLRETWGLTDAVEGVVVLEVNDPSQTKIQEADVIVSVQRSEVETVEDVREAVDAATTEGRSSVLVLIDRAGTRTFVAIPLAQT